MSLEPVMMKIEEVIQESSLAKSFMFKGRLEYQPGQFVMLWIPRLDEKPFSISYYGKDLFGITVALRGRFTQRLHEMKAGEWVGIRGPFGTAFKVDGEKVCVVGGGVGMASLAVLIERLGDRAVVVQGARMAPELLYHNRFKDMLLCTEDGSTGTRGVPTDLLEDLYRHYRFNVLYTCGPEAMMAKVLEFAREYNIYMQASLERYIKCAVGLCGQCSCNGLRLCIEGPVLDGETLGTLEDFGRYARLRNGIRVPIEAYTGKGAGLGMHLKSS
jgi:dihydroorotate dehydrogenase electron transfer subunit